MPSKTIEIPKPTKRNLEAVSKDLHITGMKFREAEKRAGWVSQEKLKKEWKKRQSAGKRK